MSENDRQFHAYQIYPGADMPITTAPLDREWMDASHLRNAYRCLPLAIANQSGWMIPNPTSFTAVWDGRPGKENLALFFDPPGNQGLTGSFGVSVISFSVPVTQRDSRITSHFGNGVVTFSMPYLFRTPAGMNLWVKGPSNWIKDGAQPLEGIVETDWLPATFTMNWKLTRPNYPVRFERGEPICMLVPVPRGLAESLEPVLTPLANNPELEKEYREWEKSRAMFNADLASLQPEAVQRGWQRDYMKGLTPRGQRATEHQTRLQLREFSPQENQKPQV
jgi:hypothetical protein